MKSIIDEVLNITYAVGYNKEPIKQGSVYFSIGNTIWKYVITAIIDPETVQYKLYECRTDGKWYRYSGINEPKITKSCYFISRNLYEVTEPDYYDFI